MGVLWRRDPSPRRSTVVDIPNVIPCANWLLRVNDALLLAQDGSGVLDASYVLVAPGRQGEALWMESASQGNTPTPRGNPGRSPGLWSLTFVCATHRSFSYKWRGRSVAYSPTHSDKPEEKCCRFQMGTVSLMDCTRASHAVKAARR